eukprot:NODE_311_length_11244_cov_0.423419.p6 type:complete len:166 gc:universal NODE_311_length_11244_cov_0.423419:6362-5865(-)
MQFESHDAKYGPQPARYESDAERLKKYLFNKMLNKEKVDREELFPLSNFSAFVDSYYLDGSNLCTKEGPFESSINLNNCLMFSDTHAVKNGKGLFDDPFYKKSQLIDIGGYCCLLVFSTDGVESWIDLDYFIGYSFHRLCVNLGEFNRINTNFSDDEKSRLCQYY